MQSSFSVNASVTTLDPLLENTTFAAIQLAQWENNHTGAFALQTTNQFAWLRLPNNASIFQTVKDPSAGPTSAHFEFLFAVSSVNLNSSFFFSLTYLPLKNKDKFASSSAPPTSGNFFTMVTNLVSPVSRESFIHT